MLPYFYRFPNLASTLRIHLDRQAHLQTLSQNHKTLQISSQIFQTSSKLFYICFDQGLIQSFSIFKVYKDKAINAMKGGMWIRI